MMRNCFKRYDKANSNIDFNSLSSAGGQNTNAQQPTANGGMQPVQSPLIKSGTLKTQKSTTLNPSLQNVRNKQPLFIYLSQNGTSGQEFGPIHRCEF